MTDKLIEEIDEELMAAEQRNAERYIYWLRDMADRETMPVRPCPKALRATADLFEKFAAELHQCRDRMRWVPVKPRDLSISQEEFTRQYKQEWPQPPQQAARRPTGYKDADGNDICEGDTLENGLGDVIGEVQGNTVGPDNWPLSNVEMVRVRVVVEQGKSDG